MDKIRISGQEGSINNKKILIDAVFCIFQYL